MGADDMYGDELKYRMTETTKEVLNRGTFYQIEALVDIPEKQVKKGDSGGWIQKMNNLSQLGNCWIDSKSYVGGNARVEGDSTIINSEVFDKCRVTGEALIKGSLLKDRSTVYGNAVVTNSLLSGQTIIKKGTSVAESRLKNVQCGIGEVYIYGSHLDFEKRVLINMPNDESISIVDVKMRQQGKEGSSISRGGYLYKIEARQLNSIQFRILTNIKYVNLSGRLMIQNSDSRTEEVCIIGETEAEPVRLEKVDLRLNGCSIRGRVSISGFVFIKNGKLADYAQIHNKTKLPFHLKNVNASEMSVVEKRSKNELIPEDIIISGDTHIYL